MKLFCLSLAVVLGLCCVAFGQFDCPDCPTNQNVVVQTNLLGTPIVKSSYGSAGTSYGSTGTRLATTRVATVTKVRVRAERPLFHRSLFGSRLLTRSRLASGCR